MRKIDRKGETTINNRGEKITIIEYRNYDDLDVQFEDGSIVEYRTYQSFIKGNIKRETSIIHKGETAVALNGQTMAIISFRKKTDIDIQFEDGTIVKHKNYQNFQRELIKNPNTNRRKHINEEKESKYGYKMTIVEYRNIYDLDVQIENGPLVEHKTYQQFAKDRIKVEL